MIDLRSDTLTLPSSEMLDTILKAQLGDDGRTDVNGRGEDPTVNELEDLAAEMTGKESAVLFSSGTLANTTALLTYCRPGDRVLIEETIHVYKTEKVVFDPRFGQLTPIFYSLNDHGTPDLCTLEMLLKTNKIKLICIENTHNAAGGVCIPLDEMASIKALADRYKVPVHMDGARLFNAAIALDVDARDICKYVDSVMFCISKGLGAPIGSLLCGNEGFIRDARSTRKLLGGAMRQAGVFAAPGIYALKNNVKRLKDDHENAKYVWEHLQDLKKTKVQKNVQSNMVMLYTQDTGLTADEYCRRIKEMGLLVRPSMANQVRLVFYNGITRDDAIKVVEIIRAFDLLL